MNKTLNEKGFSQPRVVLRHFLSPRFAVAGIAYRRLPSTALQKEQQAKGPFYTWLIASCFCHERQSRRREPRGCSAAPSAVLTEMCSR